MEINALPPAHEIDHTEIRQAAEKCESTETQLQQSQKKLARAERGADLSEEGIPRRLENGRAKAEWLDARAAEVAMAEGKATPRRRHVAEYEKKLDDLEHEVKIAKLAVQRAHGELQAVLDKHQAEWIETLTIQAENLEQEWNKGVEALSVLFAQRTALDAQRRRLGTGVSAIGAIRMKLNQLTDSLSGDPLATTIGHDPWDPTAGQRRRAVIPTGDVLTALASLGIEEEIRVVRNTLGDQFKVLAEHSQTVRREYHPDEDKERARAEAAREKMVADQDAADGPSEGPSLFLNGRRVSVHVPGSDD